MLSSQLQNLNFTKPFSHLPPKTSLGSQELNSFPTYCKQQKCFTRTKTSFSAVARGSSTAIDKLISTETHYAEAAPVKATIIVNFPVDTLNGLKGLREEEKENLRGYGQGKRRSFERIYDYEVYNDPGDPDNSDDLARPVLGGKKYPHPGQTL